MSAFIYACEHRGFQFSAAQDRQEGTTVIARGDAVRISLRNEVRK